MNRGRFTTGLVLAAAVTAVLGATLFSADAPWQAPTRSVGVPRGSVADLVRNLVLFAPLGVALDLGGVRTWRALGLAFALSTAVEVAQLAIPGRFASLWDVAANVAGTALGVGVARSAG